ncbi:VWA domain-containing protein [Bacterioplanoides sp.]|uniref:VWA domain-containing protein n=1 Tax=Bacterioplanoides sp. TaxID=2066072 RepID=UPI003BA98BD8
MEWLQQFHFLRPMWLLALLPALVVFVLLLQRQLSRGQWHKAVDAHLLPHLLDNTVQQQSRNGSWLVLIAWLLTTLALAGPSWQKLPAPVQKNQDALVILLDMSLSMAAQDIKPDRTTRAIQKITDIIRARQDGLTALISYSGEAHTVTPLTDDHDTIQNLLPSLSPFIMPKPGSRPDKAIALAQQLVNDSGINRAQLLLITDGIQNKDIQRIQNIFEPQRFQLSLLVIGTEEGAPIAVPNSGFLRDGSGNIVLPQLDLEPIRELSQQLSVPWQPLRFDDSDWQSLLHQQQYFDDQNALQHTQFDQWHDQGYWLIFLLLPAVLMLFRRGVLFASPATVILALLIIAPLFKPTNVLADEQNSPSFWQNLWRTPDQQGAELIASDPATAASRFNNPDWQGVAAYQAGDFQQSADAFANNQTATGRYNYGNALAQNGQYQEALAAYDEALQQDPDFEDAKTNRQLVEQALKQQEQQNQQQQQQQQGQNQQQDQQNQQGSEQQQNQDQNQQQQGSDQQQNSEQQSPEQQEQGQQQNASEQNQSSQEDDAFAEQKAREKAEQKSKESAKQEEEESAEQESKANVEQKAQENAEPENQTQQAQHQTEPQTDLSREEQAAMQQWLNRIPDEPGNLLQRKFLYQYRQQAGENDQQEDVLW